VEDRQVIERRPLKTAERNFPHDEENPSDRNILGDLRNSASTESAPASNGSGVTAASPLPDRLREQERLISKALTEPTAATELADLLTQTDLAIVHAEQHAKLENDRALDPLQSRDPQAARQAAEDATFVPPQLRDSAPRQQFADARQFWDANRDGLLVVDAARLGGTAGNRPGFRVLDNDLGRAQRQAALADAERFLNDAHRRVYRAPSWSRIFGVVVTVFQNNTKLRLIRLRDLPDHIDDFREAGSEHKSVLRISAGLFRPVES
jgi:hypothetical protein